MIKRVKPIKWWEDNKAKELIKKINDFSRAIEEKQIVLNDYNKKQKSLGPLELFVPGENTIKFINLIVGGVEYLSEEVHEAVGFTFLIISPIFVALGTPGAMLVDGYKTIERDVQDVFELGPSGRYLSKPEVDEILNKIEDISKKIDELKLQLNQIKK